MNEPVSTIPGITIKRLLGEGGMAHAYLVDYAGQPAVLKVAKPSFNEYIAHEAQILSQLDHPNIIRFISFPNSEPTQSMIIDGEARQCLLLEYQAGGSLAEFLDTKRLTRKQILNVIEQVAKALDFAHEKGIVHLDVKPSNILFDKKHKQVVLADFSVADLENFTEVHDRLGTTLYIAPERFDGENTHPSMDIFSLGVVIAQILYSDDSIYISDNTEVFGRPNILKLSKLKNMIMEMPKEISKFLEKAIHEDPKQRYKNTYDLFQSLRIVLPWKILQDLLLTVYKNKRKKDIGEIVKQNLVSSQKVTRNYSSSSLPEYSYAKIVFTEGDNNEKLLDCIII